jgi:glutamine cyclotransferase
VAGALLATLATAACGAPSAQAPARQDVAALRVEVVARYPHDPAAFTQGLVLDGTRLFESTGLVGRSSLREVELATGRVLRQRDVPAPYFAEGLALAGETLIQLTWQDGRAFTYARDSFVPGATFEYGGEGWGLCHDGQDLVMSDGSAGLTFRGPSTFRVQRQLTVRLRGAPVGGLNELECVRGDVYANVWTTDRIVRIDAASGAVTATIDASGLLPAAQRAAADVLNGIAYDAASDTFLITGKLWPTLFRVKLVAVR